MTLTELKALLDGATPAPETADDVLKSIVGTLQYLNTQARTGAIHPQVVIQNTELALKKYDAFKNKADTK
jgi:hypothetical protein